jgi:DNA-binding XRE family transcriptional regulator
MEHSKSQFSPPQRIRTPSGEEMVILPAKDYDALIETLREGIEDAADIAAANAVMARIESGEESTIPLDVVKKMRKENRIKVLREHREMTQKQLAEAAGTDPMYISQLETGRARGGLDVLRNVAKALKVDLDMLIPPLKSNGTLPEYGKRPPNMKRPAGRGKKR